MLEKIQDLLSDLEELIDERGEKEDFLDEATSKGEAHEADQIASTIEEIQFQIEDLKLKIEREVRSI
jgi:hypothetical protein